MKSFQYVHMFQIELEFESVGFLGEGKTGVPEEKKPVEAKERIPCEQWFLQAGRYWRNHCSQGKERTNNKLNPHMASTSGFEPGPHWWETSALTTASP